MNTPVIENPPNSNIVLRKRIVTMKETLILAPAADSAGEGGGNGRREVMVHIGGANDLEEPSSPVPVRIVLAEESVLAAI